MFSCVLNHQLPFQTYLATYFVCTDLILLYQYFHFGQGENMCSEDALKINNLHDQSTDDEESRLLLNTTPALEMTQTTDSSITNYGSADTSNNAKTLFMGILLFGFKLGSTTLTTTTTTSTGIQSTPISLGWLLAWACTTFYFVSRIPQIHKNYKRHSTQGLSLALFSFAVSGNLTYAASILIHPGHTRRTLMESLPYLTGSISTLFLDAIIFGQFMYYRHNNIHPSSIDATTTTLNRVLTHQ
jgi:uncharacterized protein with PQ loop repeat